MEQQAKSTLEKFCSWIHYEHQNQYPYGVDYDIAAYLTRKEIGPAGIDSNILIIWLFDYFNIWLFDNVLFL